ncbi:MAG TPA: alkaline phosphatase family protein [Opitutus sp.]|nr:alkaline phosphatase family protein [Opitutus sp.]
MFENQYRSYVLANPYFRGLARQGIELANFHGVMHPSQTNYIASIAGELCNFSSDDPPTPPAPQRTIADLIEESADGLAWKAYMESFIPQNALWTPQLVPANAFPYVIKHDPFSSFANIVGSAARWQRIGNEADFFADLLNGTLPEYAWFTPNMWNDGHYLLGTQQEANPRAPAMVDQAAAWLEQFFGTLKFPGPDSHLPPRTLVVVTFDESDFEQAEDPAATDKYFYDGPNQIYTVLLGDHLTPGVEHEGYNHYSVLRTIEENFRLGTLGKNDAAANWFRFLWGERFRWAPAMEQTPIATTGALAVAALSGTACVVYANAAGELEMRTHRRGGEWSEPRPVGLRAGPEVALAGSGDRLMLVTTDAAGAPVAVGFDFARGWDREPVKLAGGPATALALAAFGARGEQLMFAYRGADGGIVSRRWCDGDWFKLLPTGHRTDGALALGALGASLQLVFKTPGTSGLSAVTLNGAEFNVVTLAASQYAGPYDDTTIYAWSPSSFSVARFGTETSASTPGEREPRMVNLLAGAPLALASLDGVLHLVHPAPDGPGLHEDTFSIAGVLTAKLPVSYNLSDELTTSDGYGTLAEAGWNGQRPLNGASLAGPARLACAQVDGELIVLFHGEPGERVSLVRGGYHCD